jgi:uncharacterized protein with von Willebrand factor type A (vWA) domain
VTGPVPARLLDFVDALRDNGVRVAQQETLDAMRALGLVGADAFARRETLAALLRATLIKRSDHEPVFERVFALHFAAPLDLEDTSLDALERTLAQRGVDAEVARGIADRLGRGGGAGHEELIAALARGDAEAVQRLLASALEDTETRGLTSSFQIGYFTGRLLARAGVPDAETAVRDLADQMGGREGEQLRRAFDERFLELRRLARRAMRREYDKRFGLRDRRGTDALLELPIARLDAEEVRRMREVVRRLAQRLRARVKRREHRRRRGALDVRHTLRASLGTDGAPMKLAWRKRRRDRPELIVLCDVSDSVRAASVFMLELVYSLTELFRRVRSFVFVDRIGETTALFADANIDEAIARVQAGEAVSLFANSDYGRALTELDEAIAASLTRRTTVVVLGDGRTNYRPAHAEVITELRRRSRAVLWLCPEGRGTWGFGDSAMPAYARAATRAFEVRTLAQLADAVDRIAF